MTATRDAEPLDDPPPLRATVQRRAIGDNLDAPETLAFCIPTLAILPCVIIATYVRMVTPELAHTQCSSQPRDPPAFLPTTTVFGGRHLYEPFASTSNLCYFASGAFMIVYSMPNRGFVYPHVYTMGVLYIILGGARITFALLILAPTYPHPSPYHNPSSNPNPTPIPNSLVGSWSFHEDQSRLGTWQHAVRAGPRPAHGMRPRSTLRPSAPPRPCLGGHIYDLRLLRHARRLIIHSARPCGER
jgi:hypothetical protein